MEKKLLSFYKLVRGIIGEIYLKLQMVLWKSKKD